METPSSMTRLTRSHTRSNSRALHDITNDSPIVGLASGGSSEKTPSSVLAKASAIPKSTPGSGESLLRGQVKNLLQKVEEDNDVVKKPSQTEQCASFKALLRHLQSPGQLLAPTPENTPLFSTLSGIAEECGNRDDVSDKSITSQVVETLNQETLNLEECEINRALQFDSPNKSEVSDCNGSSITCQVSPVEESDASAWSVQVNASLSEVEEENINNEIEEEVIDDKEQEEVEEYYEDAEEDEDWFDVLCEGMDNMTVNEEDAQLPKFCGKHTRFVYKGGDGDEEEIVVEEEVKNVVLLKGMPVPQGKHLRFQEDEEN